MRVLKGLIHLLATPVFWGLAGILYLNPSSDHGAMAEHMAMMGMDVGPANLSVWGHLIPVVVSSIIGSMWLMYALMGLFHLGPWLDLLKAKPKSCDL